ncbi:hypothetical protein [Inhella proteolytica]|uniref:Alpha/beta hydrolase n=1 Tax=Inhella proteolytica TaxID=2795029 RepID=A0A931J1U0_9BURK|nr:hypothetical protein [Inhella proteolytica]MBH9577163.1 hypothetical protein [Inhella proteolytica]
MPHRALLVALLVLAGAARGAPDCAAPTRQALRIELPAPGPQAAEVALALPSSCTERAPLLIVSTTSDAGYQSSRALMAVYQPAALAAGWALLAVDPDPPVPSAHDTLALRWQLLQAALAAARQRQAQLGRAGLALAGFSGGAKYASWLAALLVREGEPVTGLFLSGVNEDQVSPAARSLEVLDGRYRQLPIVLQSGRADAVATPRQHRAVEAALREQGFRQLRLRTVDGGHAPSIDALPEALAWFAERMTDTRRR